MHGTLFRRPISAASLKRTLDRIFRCVPRARNAMAQSEAFVCVGSTPWNELPPSVRSMILPGGLAYFRSFKSCLFSLGLSHWIVGHYLPPSNPPHHTHLLVFEKSRP